MAEVSFWEAWFLWRDALLSAVVTSVLLAYLGLFVVLSRNAFASAAIAQLAALGVVAALLLGASPDASLLPVLAGMGAGLLGAPFFAVRWTSRRVPPDARLATFLVGAQATTVLGARFLARAHRHVQSALFGDAVVASSGELYLLLGVAVLVALLHVAFRHRFLLAIFDPESARAQGMRTGWWSGLLGLTIGLSIAAATRGLGALPSFAFSVVPAATGLAVARGLRGVVAVAVVLAVCASAGGYYLSFVYDLPTGASMVGLLLGAASTTVLFPRLRSMLAGGEECDSVDPSRTELGR